MVLALITLVSLCVAALWAFSRFSPKDTNRPTLIAILLLLTGLTMFMLSDKSIGIYHLYHLVFPPKDLYQPSITSKFNFHEKDFVAEYKFIPRYRDIYELGFKIQPNILSSGWGKDKDQYNFSGKLKVQIYQEGNLVDDAVITKHSTSFWYQDGNMDFIKSVSLYSFPIPIKGFLRKEITIHVKVIEPAEMLEQFKENINLTIRVSPIE